MPRGYACRLSLPSNEVSHPRDYMYRTPAAKKKNYRVLIENRFACVGRWFVKPQLTDAVRNVATPIATATAAATATTCAINRYLYIYCILSSGADRLISSIAIRFYTPFRSLYTVAAGFVPPSTCDSARHSNISIGRI